MKIKGQRALIICMITSLIFNMSGCPSNSCTNQSHDPNSLIPVTTSLKHCAESLLKKKKKGEASKFDLKRGKLYSCNTKNKKNEIVTNGVKESPLT